jgi:hypothetical protein
VHVGIFLGAESATTECHTAQNVKTCSAKRAFSRLKPGGEIPVGT